MGVPYSKQIDLAFNQFGPFLQQSKTIFWSIAAFQVITVLLLSFLLLLNLLAMLALLITVNPDLGAERRAAVTPAVRWLASWVFRAEATTTAAAAAATPVTKVEVSPNYGRARKREYNERG